MKKTKFVSLVAAMFAASTFFSSCVCHEDSPSTDITEVETGVVTYSIAVQSNVETEVQVVGVKTQTIPAGGEYVFENLTGSKYKVIATAVGAGDFLPSKIQEVDVEFTEEKVSSVIVLNYVDANSKSAKTVAELPITGTTATSDILIKNDAAAEVEGTKETIPATLAIPASTTVTDGNGAALSGDQTFSVVAYTLPVAQDEELPEEAVTPAVTLECKPDGTQFSGEGATLQAYIGKEVAGAEVDVNGDTYTVDSEGYVTFKVKHFSSHTVGVKTNSKFTKEDITLVNNESINITEGENEFNYERYFGWKSSAKIGFFFTWHTVMFGGEWTKEPVVAKFEATAAGTGTINITQEVLHYTIKSGILTFYTDVYGAVTVTVTPDSGSGASGHSGGSGN